MELQTYTRTELGRKAKKIRAQGRIPAELFGSGIENKHLSVPAKEFKKLYDAAGENTVITLVIDEKEKVSALISEVQQNGLSQSIIAIDFRAVRRDEKIQVAVPISYAGTDMAAKNGFIIVKILDEIEIEALPQEIPHEFVVDITPLENPGQSIEVKDVAIPKGVKIKIPEDTVIVTVTEKEKEIITEAPPQEEEPAEGETAKEDTAEEK
jgi:large subunit ribosomal protein L25